MATRTHILAHMKSDRYQPVKTRGLARFFDIREEDYDQFRSLIKEMVAEGEIVEARGKLVAAALEKKLAAGTFTGLFRLSAKGFGFIEPDDAKLHDDVFVPPGQTLDAITGDRVLARRVRRGQARPGQLPYTGTIIEVLSRGHSRFVGTYRLRGKFGSIKPDGGVLLIEDIPVLDPTASGVQPNDKVVFELLKYPAMGRQAEAVIVEVLGPRGQPGVDTLAVIRQFELPDVFSDRVLDAARAAADRFTQDEVANRTDLRDLLCITIDPVDARDFDDAVSVENLKNGLVRLGVHIADVSFFVRPGEPLDEEAYKRGTSVYLPQKVVPMLPELLSNGVCSLQEGQDRLVQSAFIDLDGEARVVATHFANSIIRNKKRMTYEQVSAVLDEGRNNLAPPEVVKLLSEMNALARRILQRRRRQGYLELDLPEVDLIYNENGEVIDAKPEDTSFSHKIIEMFMVEANEAVARRLASHHRPFMRRVHEDPSPDKLEQLGNFLRSCGLPIKNPRDRLALQTMLKETKSLPAAYPVNVAVLRSMMRAEYAVSDAGHWALASECYCHFTSPIRRYPDLTIHRGLARLEHWSTSDEAGQPHRGGRHKERPPVDEEATLVEGSAHCSRTERRAEAAERELTKIKVLTLLEKHVGDEFTGVVAALEDYGLFIEIPKYMIEGLLHIDQFRDDEYAFDRRNFTLFGRKSGRKIRVGDTIHVVIAAVDIPRRQLDLAPAPGSPFGTVPPKAAAKEKQKDERRKAKSERHAQRRNQGRRR